MAFWQHRISGIYSTGRTKNARINEIDKKISIENVSSVGKILYDFCCCSLLYGMGMETLTQGTRINIKLKRYFQVYAMKLWLQSEIY